MKPISRFLLFSLSLIALVVIAAVASPAKRGAHPNKSMDDICVCVPTRAALIVKATIARAQARSTELVAMNQTAGR